MDQGPFRTTHKSRFQDPPYEDGEQMGFWKGYSLKDQTFENEHVVVLLKGG